jgi:hypothetical protein
MHILKLVNTKLESQPVVRRRALAGGSTAQSNLPRTMSISEACREPFVD